MFQFPRVVDLPQNTMHFCHDNKAQVGKIQHLFFMLETFISEFIEKHLDVRSIVKRGILKHGGRIASHGPKSP
jgi:hypothetical protein